MRAALRTRPRTHLPTPLTVTPDNPIVTPPSHFVPTHAEAVDAK